MCDVHFLLQSKCNMFFTFGGFFFAISYFIFRLLLKNPGFPYAELLKISNKSKKK